MTISKTHAHAQGAGDGDAAVDVTDGNGPEGGSKEAVGALRCAEPTEVGSSEEAILPMGGANGKGSAPTSFNRAIMRTSTSLPSLTDHRPPPIPQPSRRVGDSRIHRVVIAK